MIINENETNSCTSCTLSSILTNNSNHSETTISSDKTYNSLLSILKISVIIPAFNEEERIIPTINNLLNFFLANHILFEIIVVDDGSTDSTSDVINRLSSVNSSVKLIRLPDNMGKGFAVKAGMLAANGELLVFMDADGAAEISDILKLVLAIKNGADIAIGSRVIRSPNINVSTKFIRAILRKVLNIVVRMFLFDGIYDTQCGFKMFTKESAKYLFEKQQLSGYGFDMELLFLAKNAGFKIKEVPINWKAVPKGKLNPFWDSFRILADIVRIKRLYKVKG